MELRGRPSLPFDPRTFWGLLFAFFLLMGCSSAGGGGEGGSGELNTVVYGTQEVPPGEACPYGGTQVDSGVDENGNGTLDPEEIDQTQYVCNGFPGTVVAVSDEPPGPNCPLGGLKIDYGVDLDGDGLLDEGEGTSTNYLCNGGGELVAQPTAPPESPAAQFTLNANGGGAVGGGGFGGGGGTLLANITQGTITGHVKLFNTGLADAGFSVPAYTPYLGPNPLVVDSGPTSVASYPDGEASEIGEVHFHEGDDTLWEWNGSSDVPVTGVSVAAGATLSLAVNLPLGAPTTASISVVHDFVNLGTILVPPPPQAFLATNLQIAAGRYLGGAGSVVNLNGGIPGSSGGDATLSAATALVNQGAVTSNGGPGGNGGNVRLASFFDLVNTGNISARGGDGPPSSGLPGGTGGTIILSSNLGDLENGGTLDTSGGDADLLSEAISGGDGNDITLAVKSAGVVRNSGALVANGGEGTAEGGDGYLSYLDGQSGQQITGAGITLASACGGVVNSGDISAVGGPAADSGATGGLGGPVTIAANYLSTCLSVESPLNVEVSGNIDASGGDGETFGGQGGVISIGVISSGLPLGQEVVLLGYSAINLNGGAVSEEGTGGRGGIFLADNGFDRMPTEGNSRAVEIGGGGAIKGLQGAFGFTLPEGNAAVPSGGVYNYVPLSANGGTVDTGTGGSGGSAILIANLLFSGTPVFEVAANHATLNLNGADGDSGGNTSSVTLLGRNGAENSGAINMINGDGIGDTNAVGGSAGGGGGGKGQTVTISAGMGPAVNTGTLSLTGGNATGADGLGGNGHLVEIIGRTATNSGDIDTSGGDGGLVAPALMGRGGDAGNIILESTEGVSVNTGALTFPGGTGYFPGQAGAVYLDNLDVTCDYVTCAP